VSILNPKQARFVAEYLKDCNAAQAYIRAGYSPKTAETCGPRLLRTAQVAAEVAAAQQRRIDRVEVKADDVLRELLRIATVDLGEAYDEHGNLRPIQDIPKDVRRAIAGIKVFDEFDGAGRDRVKIGEVREVKFWDKPRALELLGKHLKLFTDVVEHQGKLTLEQLVSGSLPSAEVK
jgi:phage terminase small subunit